MKLPTPAYPAGRRSPGLPGLCRSIHRVSYSLSLEGEDSNRLARQARTVSTERMTEIFSVEDLREMAKEEEPCLQRTGSL